MCPFVCDSGACRSATNVTPEIYQACNDTAPPLTPPSGAGVAVGDGPQIECTPDCGDGSTTVIAAGGTIDQGSGPGLAWFCLSRIDLPSDVTVDATIDTDALLLFSDGPVTIAGDVDAEGGGSVFSIGGSGGPGAENGATIFGETAGIDGSGACPGLGGSRVGPQLDRAAGGGGGGGFGSTGGAGGNGRNPGDDVTAPGGAGGGTCGAAELSPLVGGSGGGTGGDGTCGSGGACAGGGGGGGGAIQIASRVSIALSGDIDADGGDGGSAFSQEGGGGGGGSGGAILLEAPIVTVNDDGELSVEGGDGADAGAGNGGNGASSGQAAGDPGADAQSASEGGAGGGGGAGRVRINSAGGVTTCGSFVTPTAACTAGALN